MKKFKKLFISLCILALASSAFSITSGLRYGSASTIMDDSYHYMNLFSWNQLEFDKFFAFTDINSNSSLNFSAAQHVKGNNVLAYSYQGNLWTNNGYNNFALFYGFNDMALTFSLGLNENAGTYSDQYTEVTPTIFFGMKATDKLSFSLDAGIESYKDKDDDISLSYFSFNLGADLLYKIKQTDKLNSFITFYYDGAFQTATLDITGFDPNKSSQNNNAFGLRANLEYKPTDTFTYGLVAYFPVLRINSTEDTSVTTLSFQINNGFQVELKPNKIYTSFGLITTLPSFTFEKDQDTQKGSLYNSFYFGLAFKLSPQILIDGCCSIEPHTGISIDDIWNEKLSISITAKF